jgi:hypothetical protein
MKRYTKHQIRRIRDLNENFFEVVFNKESLNFVPGSTVTLYKGADFPIFIASGIQEPWLRIILRKDLFSPNFIPGTTNLKLNVEIDNKLPNLVSEEKPSFVFDTQTIGAFFSWASTNAGKKCNVCYVGDNKIQEGWIKTYHKMVKPSDIRKMLKYDGLYVTGNRDLYEGRAKKVLDQACGSFILE